MNRINRIAAALAVVLVSLFVPAAPAEDADPDKPKTDKIVWGKEVKGLAVSIAPAADGKKGYVVRWKNVGKDTLELPWVRFGSDQAYKHLDDLLNHVFLKDADGKLAPARKYKAPIIGGPPY